MCTFAVNVDGPFLAVNLAARHITVNGVAASPVRTATAVGQIVVFPRGRFYAHDWADPDRWDP
ncbi:hypothetical protein [Streptomyces sp. SID12501]|uniref:Uncharacterized protein n=1 Tax=Streptomyces sp. SID12501 TaxID=2706042 RepID=A0A6B3BW67_9ACTN|nr:hypothetical protein [Streptomyces sp. SID12501]NEC88603.1 hypothetical protein [Streptomyces sp. SID12501]